MSATHPVHVARFEMARSSDCTHLTAAPLLLSYRTKVPSPSLWCLISTSTHRTIQRYTSLIYRLVIKATIRR